MRVIAPGNADAYILGLGRVPFQPLLVDLENIGVVGVEVSLPDLDSNFRAWVYDDISVAFAQLGGAQYTFLILLIFVAGLSIAAIVNTDVSDPSVGLGELHAFAGELEHAEDSPRFWKLHKSSCVKLPKHSLSLKNRAVRPDEPWPR